MINVPPHLKQAFAGIKYIDLFAGIGAFRYALSSFGGKCVFSSEWDEACQATYEANHGERPCGDITKVSVKDIPSHDILCAGLPCQPFSRNGKKKGFKDPRGVLFYEVCRIAKFHKPKIIFLENVDNLERHSNGKTIKTIRRELEKLGYSVTFKVLNSADFGVPQSRHRIFILAFKGKCKFKWDLNTLPPVPVSAILEPKEKTKKLIISDMMRIKLDKNITIPNSPSRKPVRIGKINKGRQGERVYNTIGAAITLSSSGGGIGARTGLYLVGKVVRRLSLKECIRLTGLPDTFKLHPSEAKSYRQLGNAIVVDVLQYIIIQIIESGFFD